MNSKVSIIIPCKDIDAQTSECIDTCKQLDHDNFEIIVFPGFVFFSSMVGSPAT